MKAASNGSTGERSKALPILLVILAIGAIALTWRVIAGSGAADTDQSVLEQERVLMEAVEQEGMNTPEPPPEEVVDEGPPTRAAKRVPGADE